METFVRTLVVVSALLLVAGLPAIVVARRANRPEIANGFGWAAVVVGFFFGLAAVSSDRLVGDCNRSGSIACLDVGYQGLLLLVGVIYLCASIVVAVHLRSK